MIHPNRPIDAVAWRFATVNSPERLMAQRDAALNASSQYKTHSAARSAGHATWRPIPTPRSKVRADRKLGYTPP